MDKAWFWNSFEISRHAAICKVLLSSGILSQHLDFINIWKENLIRREIVSKNIIFHIQTYVRIFLKK